MPLGITTFLAIKPGSVQADYGQIIGRITSDTADTTARERIDRIWKRLTKRGMCFSSHWCPVTVKPYKPLTKEQRLKRMVTKSGNILQKELDNIPTGQLFVNDLIQAANNRHNERVAKYLKRYT